MVYISNQFPKGAVLKVQGPHCNQSLGYGVKEDFREKLKLDSKKMGGTLLRENIRNGYSRKR